jgi:hypothetical protein
MFGLTKSKRLFYLMGFLISLSWALATETDSSSKVDRVNQLANPNFLAELVRSSEAQGGTAVGKKFKGDYEVRVERGQYIGPNCTAEFVKEYRIAVDEDLSLREVREIVKKGTSSYDDEIEVVQYDDWLELFRAGEGKDFLLGIRDKMFGWINEDGTFLAAELRNNGEDDANSTFGAGYIVRGKISGKKIEGEKIKFAYNFDPKEEGSKGLCINFATFTGKLER